MLTNEPRMVIFFRHVVQALLNTYLFRVSVVDPHLTTYHSNTYRCSIKISKVHLTHVPFMSNYPAQWSRVLSRNGIQQRRNSWQDGVAGTNCPILPGQSWTYHFKLKDQIGSYFYYPSLLFQKAAGGFGSIRINPRSIIPSPFAPPADDFVVLIGDWYKTNHKVRSSFRKKNTFTSMW